MQARAQITAAPARERGATATACSAIYGAELDIFPDIWVAWWIFCGYFCWIFGSDFVDISANPNS